MLFLKQGAAATIKMGPFVDATDGVTAETGLTIQKASVRLSKNGGDYAAASADQGASDVGAPHDELGEYDIALGTGDADTLGRLRVMIAVAGALPVWADFMVVPANVYDSLVGGTDKLQVHADEITAGLITAAALADNAITAAKVAADAVTEIQSGLATSAEIPTTAEIADAVWDEALAGHATAGSAGDALSAAGSAGDPWSTLLPGAYGAGTAGAILGNNLDAAVSSRASQASLDTVDGNVDAILADTGADIPAALATIAGYIDTEVAAIKAKTDNLPANPAAASDIPSAAAIRSEIDANSTKLDVAVSTRLASASYTAPLDAAGVRSAVGLASANLDTQLDAIPTAAENAAAVAARQIADGYSADGAQPTIEQAILEIRQFLMEKAVSGTTVTVKKPDGSTAAFTLTLNDASAPTGITRAS